MKIVIDTERCTGHGRCYSLAPELFQPDDIGNGNLVFPDGEVPPTLEAQARMGVANCPERAIEIVS